MKIFSPNSRFSYGILMALLIVCIAGVFILLHNQIAVAQGNTPGLAVLLTLIAIAIAITFFQKVSSYISKLQQSTIQLDQLRKSIQESKRQNEEAEKEKDITTNVVDFDFEKEAKQLIPDGEFESTEQFLEKLLSNTAKNNDIVQAIAFMKDEKSPQFQMKGSYAYFSEKEPPTFIEGETLPGQVAKNKVALNLKEVPQDYITILSGLGKGSPTNLLILPILTRSNECIGILEFASFKGFNDQNVMFFQTLGSLIAEHINSLKE